MTCYFQQINQFAWVNEECVDGWIFGEEMSVSLWILNSQTTALDLMRRFERMNPFQTLGNSVHSQPDHTRGWSGVGWRQGLNLKLRPSLEYFKKCIYTYKIFKHINNINRNKCNHIAVVYNITYITILYIIIAIILYII